MDFEKIRLKPLKGKDNYKDWADDMTAILMKESLWFHVNGVIEQPICDPRTSEKTDESYQNRLRAFQRSEDYRDWIKKNANALGIIFLGCDRETKNLLKNIIIIKEAWELF